MRVCVYYFDGLHYIYSKLYFIVIILCIDVNIARETEHMRRFRINSPKTTILLLLYIDGDICYISYYYVHVKCASV